jgi:curli biogenesis system outer membrane secretion channel CsgG
MARVSVADFKCKAAKCGGEIGHGLSDMLATALFSTGRFIVLERGEGMKDLREELALAEGGMVERGKGARKGLMEGADVMILGAVTAFDPDASGVGGGIGGGGGGFFGGLLGGKKDAYIAADLRLVDVRRSRVINATKVEGTASSYKGGVVAGGRVGSMALGGGLGGYKNTPMEQAVRDMLEKAVAEIGRMMPASYYRHGQNK